MAKRNRNVAMNHNDNAGKNDYVGKIVRVNRKYKDTVFRMLFSDRENLLSLYNAVNGSNYENPDALEIVTLENAVYMGMKNDLELKVLTLNINEGHNRELMEQCQSLREYAQYVAKVRGNTQENLIWIQQ